MKTKKDTFGSGKKLPWHFDNEDGFHPMRIPPINRIYTITAE